MKNISFLVVSIILISCASQDDFINKTDAKLERITALAILQNLEQTLNESRPEFKIKFESSKVIKLDEVYYLRAVSGDYVSTTLLKKDENGYLHSEGLTCTSRDCAHNDGCLPKPDGKSCTKCKVVLSDCTKTVSQAHFPPE